MPPYTFEWSRLIRWQVDIAPRQIRQSVTAAEAACQELYGGGETDGGLTSR